MSNALSPGPPTLPKRSGKGLIGGVSRDNRPTLPTRSCHDVSSTTSFPPLRRCESLRALATLPKCRIDGERKENADDDDTTVSFHEDEVAELAITSVECECPLDMSLSHVEEVELWITQLKFKRYVQEERNLQKHQGSEFYPVAQNELVRSLHEEHDRTDWDESRLLQRLTPTHSPLDDDSVTDDHPIRRSFALQLGLLDPDHVEVLVARAVSNVAEQLPLNHLDDAAFEEHDDIGDGHEAPRRWESGGAAAEKLMSLPSRMGPLLGKSMFTHLRGSVVDKPIHPSYAQAL